MSDPKWSGDPAPENWAEVTLPEAWPDQGPYRGLRGAWRLIRHPFAKRGKVELPAGVPGAENIPKYALLEFHHLPNGNYSDRVTHGYVKGFDRSMLGEVQRVRRRMVADLDGCDAILDVGCGGGRLTRLMMEEGKQDVWGMDPSPYLLKHAATDHPEGRYCQGIIEDIPFPDQRFDAITVLFVLHEIPPHYIRQGLAEMARVLKPGGCILLAEPSPLHFRATFFSAIRRFGFKGGYFWSLVRCVHEPYVKAWHAFDLASEASVHGLQVELVDEGMPIKYWRLRKES